MGDGLADALERMARREEVARLRAAAAAQAGHGGPTAGIVAGSAGGHRAQSGPQDSVGSELAEAIRRVVQNHPGTVVTASVEGSGAAASMQVSWADGRVVVRTGPAPDAAARLAEMIRRDPTLLAPDPE
jgi:hypothetical protein